MDAALTFVETFTGVNKVFGSSDFYCLEAATVQRKKWMKHTYSQARSQALRFVEKNTF